MNMLTLSLFALCITFCVMALIAFAFFKGDNKAWGFLFVGIGIAFLCFGLIARHEIKSNTYNAYLDACLSQDYDSAIEYENTWYCLSFCNEPRIEKLSMEVER